MMSFLMAFFFVFCLWIKNLQTRMHITKSDDEKIADLAKLRLSEEEKETFRGHLEQ